MEKDPLPSAPEAPRKTYPALGGRLLRCMEQEDPFVYHLEVLWTPSQHTRVVSLSAEDVLSVHAIHSWALPPGHRRDLVLYELELNPSTVTENCLLQLLCFLILQSGF